MRWLVLACFGLVTAACEPTYIETPAEVDIYISQGRFGTACIALRNDREPKLRQYTANLLATYPDQTVVNDCICERIMAYRHGPYDDAVLRGLEGSKRDDLSTCALPAFDKAEGEERLQLVREFGAIRSSVSNDRLAEMVGDLKEPVEVREAAALGLLPAREAKQDLLLRSMANDPAPEVRAAIAKVFEGAEQPEVVSAITKAAREDEDGGVRAAALKAVVRLKIPETDAMVCAAMLDDPDARVRLRAVRSFKGSKRDVALDCLERRLKKHEEDAEVREATMKAIYASPSPRSPKILCDNIGPFLRMYVKDLPVTRMQGADIIKHQNNRDFENSYDCVQRARAQGGYSCWGRYYLAVWTNDLGGKAHKPTCKGAPSPEMSFE
ncbi:MAG: HEAT repeat domain-containing protein [Deltaproteobacteria bacterium]|nr:MAG: HEAT repeat domain-containing protein [Deltaproteobacteria bacterium]